MGVTHHPSSLFYIVAQHLQRANPPGRNRQHNPTQSSTMLFATIITPVLLLASSCVAQMSMPDMSMSTTSMDPAMSMPTDMSSGITMTSSATSSGAGAGGGSSTMIMDGATSAQSSSSARASTNAAPGSGGPSAAMFAAIGVVTWVALG